MESWVPAIQSKQGKCSGGRGGSTILALNGGLPTFCFHDRVAFFYSKEGLTGSNQKLRQLCSQGGTRRGTKHAHTHDFGRFNGLSFMRNVRKPFALKGTQGGSAYFGHLASSWSNKRSADISLHHGTTHGWQLRTKNTPQKLDSKVGFY